MKVHSAAGARALLLLLAALVVQGCAHRISEVTPADIPRLETALRAAPADVDLRTRLGIAHFKAGSFDVARTTLGRAVDDGATSGAAFLHLGLANEEMGDWAGARAAYARYLDVGRFDRLRGELEDRLALVIRNELQAEARAALRREDELARAEPTSRTIAVFPFRMISDDPDFAPLSFALADMVITDLSLSGAVTVLERTRVQNLLDEMALTEAGYTAPESGARAGRLLRAEHVVQGALTTLGSDALRFDADVLQTVQGRAAGTVSNEDALSRLFDLEKEMVFGILDVLGVEITPAEREAINERWTDNLLAFIAYGRGLESRDRGDFSAASGFFQQAAQLDPGFARAQAQQAEAARLQQASTASTQQLSRQTESEVPIPVRDVETQDLLDDGNLLRSMVDEVSPNAAMDLVDRGGTGDRPNDRNPTQEATGQEGITTGSTFTIILRIPRPGGD